MRAHTHICAHTRMTFMCKHSQGIHTRTYTCVGVPPLCPYEPTHTHMHTFTDIHTHVHTRTCTRPALTHTAALMALHGQMLGQEKALVSGFLDSGDSPSQHRPWTVAAAALEMDSCWPGGGLDEHPLIARRPCPRPWAPDERASPFSYLCLNFLTCEMTTAAPLPQ